MEVWRQRIGLISYGLTKNSPYRIFIDSAIIDLFENGQIRKIIQKWTTSQQNCPKEDNKLPLGFEKLIFILIIIGFGVLMSMIMVAYERISYSRKIARWGRDEIKIRQKVEGIRKCLIIKKTTDEQLISLLDDPSCEVMLE